MTNQNDLVIVEKVLGGDANAYAIIVENYKDMAVTLAYNILLSREDAEEAAQDAFIKAYTGLKSYNGSAKFSTWLFRIIINTSLNKKKMRKLKAVEITEHPDNFLVDSQQESATLIHDQRKFIQLSLQSLNEKERICITLYYLNEFHIEEIKEITGISVSNIKVLLHRGRKSLHIALHKRLKNETTTLM